jgi:two-component system, NarL family, sensor histidine kinase UhpB
MARGANRQAAPHALGFVRRARGQVRSRLRKFPTRCAAAGASSIGSRVRRRAWLPAVLATTPMKPEPKSPLAEPRRAADAAPALVAVPGDDARLGTLRHAAHEAIVTIDAEQRIVMINPAAQRMFGCSAAEALGSKLARFIPERYRAAHAQHVRRFAESDEIERTMGERLPVTGLRSSGEEFPLAVTIARAHGAGAFGDGEYFTALMRDLSVEHGLRSALDTLRRRFEAVFEFSPNAVWIADGERIVFANRACEKLFAAPSRASLLGRSIYDLLDAQSHDPVRTAVARAFHSGEAVSLVQERIGRLDGHSRDVEIALAPLPDHGQTTLQMVISDVTQLRREAQDALQAKVELRGLSERLVEAREDERRRIARELHDELGQRLTALKLELASLKPGARVPAARSAAMVEMLDDTVASVRRIAADLRPLMLDDLGFNAAVDWLVRDTARRMGIAVSLKLDEQDPRLDDRSTTALYRMVQEALTNVARHAHATSVEVQVHEDADRLTLTVRDNGSGFPERATEKAGSFGLMGMRERVFMLGGEMQIDNPEGGGGRITVRLPLAPTR